MNKQHWTVEQFANENLSRFSQGRILTEADLRESTARTLVSLTEVLIHGEDREAITFYTDNHSWGPEQMPDTFVPCTVSLPLRIAPRPKFESGVLDTPAQAHLFDKHCAEEASQYRKTRFIFSIEELVEHLNKYY